MQVELDNEKARAGSGDVAERLARARVLVIGVGALGSPAAWHLAAAGVGTLLLVDPDRVELSNLPRQLLYDEACIGRLKVDCAAERLRARVSGPRVEVSATEVTADNAAALIATADFTIDATDGARVKFAINDAAVAVRRPFCHAGVLGFFGQLLTVHPGDGACLRCLFPVAPDDGEIATCRQAGVVAPIAGIIGALQAAEAISVLLGEPRAGGLLTYDGRTGRWRRVALRRNPRCPLCAPEAVEDRQVCYGS
jgi:molybdopterin/thiamine biosynthesis adenylyltransferase